MNPKIGPPEHPVLSPYAKRPEGRTEAPRAAPEAHAETPVVHKRFSWHRRLALWALAGGGMLSVGYIPQPPQVVNVGTALPPPPAPQQPPWLQALGAGQQGQAPVQLAQEHLTAAVEHVASGSVSSMEFTFGLPPEQGKLAVHITEQLRSQSDQAIDIVVETEPQKPSEAQVSEAKRAIGEIGQSFLKVFGPVGLLEAGATALRDKGLELAWRKLKHMIKQLKARTGGAGVDEQPEAGDVEEAAMPAQSAASAGPVAVAEQPAANPILMRLAESFAILARLFDPTQAGPQSHTIEGIAAALGVSEREAGAILQLGPFVESSHGVWALDAHLGDPKTVVACYPLSGSPYFVSWQSWGKKGS